MCHFPDATMYYRQQDCRRRDSKIDDVHKILENPRAAYDIQTLQELLCYKGILYAAYVVSIWTTSSNLATSLPKHMTNCILYQALEHILS
jgi:hypothetical protein